MIFIAFDLVTYVSTKLAEASSLINEGFLSAEELGKLQEIYDTEQGINRALRNVAIPANSYLNAQLEKHANSWLAIKHASAFCPWNANEEKMKAAIKYFQARSWLSAPDAQGCEKEIPTLVNLVQGHSHFSTEIKEN